jgi:hypothetical protein
VKDDSSQQKSKRGRKPKKLYDIDPSGTKIGISVTFNESDNRDEESDDYELKHVESPIGPIEKNFNNHKFSFDSMGVGAKNDFNNPSHQYQMFPRKQSINNLEKMFNPMSNGYDYLHDERRRFSSTLSPYNTEFKPAKPVIFSKPISQPPQSTEETPLQKKLNEIISQSFNSWNNKPKRKETEEIDFSSIQENPILNILQKSNQPNNTQRKGNPFDFLSNSIMSPDYKPRSFSISSSGWMQPQR